MDKQNDVRSDALSNRLLDEGIVLVTKAASDLGISITSKTAMRWCLNGTRGIRLESLKIGGRRMTSRAAMRRFIAATQERQTISPPVMDREAVDRILNSYGLGRKSPGMSD